MKKIVMILLVSFLFIVPGAYADSVLDEPFETFSTGNVNGQGTWTSTRATGQYTDIDDTVSHLGSKSLHYNGFQSNIIYASPDTTPVNERTISFYWRPSNLATNDTGANGAMRVYVRLKRTYPSTYYEGFYLNFCHAGTGHRKLKMSISAVGNGTCTRDLMGDMTANNWYFIEAQYNLTTRKVKGRVDGGDWSPELTLPYSYTNFFFDQLQISNMWSSVEHFHFDNFGGLAQQQLTVSLDPQAGGGVVSYPVGDGIYCGVDGYSICQLLFDRYSDVDLDAYPNDDWAFAYWDDGITGFYDNPLTVTMDNAKTLTAKFFKTFRCATGSFYQTSGTGGWCTDYVESETGISLSGDAWQWWSGAINAGYATGSDPEISAIIVFDNSSLAYGHVGIVTDFDETTVWIQDSNWSDPYDFQIRNHTISRSRSDISGYIYCTP